MNFEFLKEFDASMFFELATAILAIVFYKKYNDSFYNFFVLYAFCAFFVELSSTYFVEGNKWWLYNLYTFFEFNSIVFIYYFLTKQRKSHQTIIFIATFFNSIYFLSFIYPSIQNYSPILLGVLVSVFVFLYLD